MKQMGDIDERDTEVELRTVDEDDEGTICSEEEREDDSDLKSLDWLISYRLPAFYSPLFDDSEVSSESMHSSSFDRRSSQSKSDGDNIFDDSEASSESMHSSSFDRRSSQSKSDDDNILEDSGASSESVDSSSFERRTSQSKSDNISPTELSTLICTKQSQRKKSQQQQSNCSTLCYLYRLLNNSSSRAISLTDLFEKFFEVNRNDESLSSSWKRSTFDSLLSSARVFPLNALERQHILLWMKEENQMCGQQRSAIMGDRLHEYLQSDATPSSRNDKDERLLERRNGSKRALLFMPYSKDVSQRLKSRNCGYELSSGTSSKRSLTAIIIDGHCSEQSASSKEKRSLK
uniref:Uncharacterized protein n=1 Tax=Parascaris univalens TaxID=6257 RepID=A0A915AQB1_PARUN